MKLCFTQLIWLNVNFKVFDGVHYSLKHERKCIRASHFHVTGVCKLYVEYKGPVHAPLRYLMYHVDILDGM